MPAPGTTVRYLEDLQDTTARAGRKVRIGATVYLSARPAKIQADNASRRLFNFLRPGARYGPDAGEIREGLAGWVLETSAEGTLAESWTVPALLQSIREATAGSVAADGLGGSVVEPVALDAEEYRETVYDPTYTDPTGEGNADFSVNYATIVQEGTERGLQNLGDAIGSGARAVGAGVSSLAGGFFSGLGLVGTLVLVLLLGVAVFFLLRPVIAVAGAA